MQLRHSQNVAWVERQRNPGLWRPFMDATPRARLRLSKTTLERPTLCISAAETQSTPR